jgi:RNA polymerase primary sigma factor
LEGTGITVTGVRDILEASPGLNKRELLRALGARGVGASDTPAVNSFLYRHQDEFEWRDERNGRAWYVRDGATNKAPRTTPSVPGRSSRIGTGLELDLYAWQRRALDAWSAHGQQGVIEAVTGAGKTRLALQAMHDALAQGRKVCVLVPTIELMHQWHREVRTHVASIRPSLRIGVLGGGGDDTLGYADVLIATASSGAHYRLLPPNHEGLLIADECHHYGAETWSAALEPQFSARLGLTATYEREDSGLDEYLTPYFGGVCYRLGYDEALADGVIAPFRIAFIGVAFSASERELYEEATDKAGRYRFRLIRDWHVPEQPFGEFMRAVQQLRNSQVEEGSRLAGFYLSAFSKRRQIMAESLAKQQRVADLAAAVGEAQRTILFAQTVRAAENAMAVLERMGHVGGVIEASMDSEERRWTFDAFERGDYTVVAAPRLLDEGVDVPAADLAIVLATSRSRRQLIQRMGRVVRRKADGRTARLAVLFVEGTAEDPAEGAHEDFLDEVTSVAEDVAVFPAGTPSDAITAFLRPHHWSRSGAAHLDRIVEAPETFSAGPSWLTDVNVDLASVVAGCAVRHVRFGEGLVLSVRSGASGRTVLARFANGSHEIVLGGGHLEFIVDRAG